MLGHVEWLSKDPLLLAAGWNVYAFCANNPVNFVDPFGLCEDYNPWSDPAVGKSVWDSIRDQFSFDPNRSGLAQIQQSGGGGTAWETAYWNAIGVSVSGVSGAFGANLFNAGAASVFFTPMASETLAAGAGTTVSQTLGGQLLVMLNVQSRAVWAIVSGIYAANATGTAQVFQRAPLAAQSIWYSVEKPILEFMGNVTILYR